MRKMRNMRLNMKLNMTFYGSQEEAPHSHSSSLTDRQCRLVKGKERKGKGGGGGGGEEGGEEGGGKRRGVGGEGGGKPGQK